MFSGKLQEWRNHPKIAPEYNRLPSNMFPGLGTAIGLFTVYCVGEILYNHYYSDKKVPHGAPVSKEHGHAPSAAAKEG